MQRVGHHNSEPIDLDRGQDPVKAIEIEVIKNVKGLTQSCTAN